MEPRKLCPHLNAKIVTRFLKEKVTAFECTETANHVLPETDEVTLWMCMNCPLLGCSRYSKNECMQKHFDTTGHPLCVNFETNNIWCYLCDEELHTLALTAESPGSQINEFERLISKVDEQSSKFKSQFDNNKDKKVIHSTFGGQSATPIETPTRSKVIPSDNIFGIRNIGNTCFFNSLTQVILNSESLLTTLRKDLPGLPSDGFIAELLKLHDTSTQGYKILDPKNLFRLLGRSKSMYSLFQQQDSHECFTHFMDIIEKEYKQAVLPFNLPVFGYLAYQTYCGGCRKEEWFFEENCSMALGLTEEEKDPYLEDIKDSLITQQSKEHGRFKSVKPSLISHNRNVQRSGFQREAEELVMDTQDNAPLKIDAGRMAGLIDRFFGYNVYQRAANGLKCDNCEKNHVQNYFGSTKYYFVTPPPILVVLLKRYRQGRFGVQKEERSVAIELDLDLTRYALERRPTLSGPEDAPPAETTSPVNKISLKYQLYGIVEQHGSLSFGHYICYVKKESGQWYYISDSHFSPVSEHEIRKNTSGYMFFYKRV